MDIFDLSTILVEPFVNKAIDESYALCENEYLAGTEGLKDGVKNLHEKLKAIQAVLRDAEERQVTQEAVKLWLRNLREAAYDAEDVLGEITTDAVQWAKEKKKKKNNKKNAKIAGEVKELLQRLDRISKDKDDFRLSENIGGDDACRPQRRDRITTPLPETQIVGRDGDKHTVIERLLSSSTNSSRKFSVLPIIGMGGLGKTTLTRLIYSDKRVVDHYKILMWACVTDDFNIGGILRQMIETHSKMPLPSNLSIGQLQSRCDDFLVNNKFLLVLDDVWTKNYEHWESLEEVLNRGGQGSSVLITSRDSEVANKFGNLETYNLECLPSEDCWSLFQKIAFKDGNSASQCSRELEDIGREIVDKCKGLPLAVKAMAGLLRGDHQVNTWKKILQSELWEIEKGQNDKIGNLKVLPALKLSYNYLPSHLKSCFSYCAIFPKSHIFLKEELVKLWMAESLIPLSDDRETPEDLGDEYFTELSMRSFFQKEIVHNRDRYRMHDLIHDLSLSISSPYCVQLKENQPPRHLEYARHLSLVCKDVEQPLSKAMVRSKKLRTLLSPIDHLKDFGNALDQIFNTLRYLRVLNLSSSTLVKLPDSIKELKLLRHLDLSKTEIGELPNSVCSLYHLITLKLLGCPWLVELPKDLKNLVNLRHLELDDMFWSKASSSTLPPNIGNLTNLHNVHAFAVGKGLGYGIEQLGNMSCLSGSLRIFNLENTGSAKAANLNKKGKLEKVLLEWSHEHTPQDEAVDEEMLDDLQPHQNIKELCISNYKGNQFPEWMRNQFLQNLQVVRLKYCLKCKVLSLGQLPQLRELYIKGMEELEELTDGHWPMLVRLHISNCPKLISLPRILLMLRVMKIKNCGRLQGLPVTPSLMFLTLSENSLLEHWREGEIVVGNARGESWRMPTCIKILELRITRCPKLAALPVHFAPQKLEVDGCELIKELPPEAHVQRLQHLALSSCPDATLLQALPNTASLYSLVVSKIAGLSSFPSWPKLPGLKTLYISGCENLHCLTGEDGEGSLQTLEQLELLSVMSCPELEILTHGVLPSKLQYLSITSCHKLKSLGPKESLSSLMQLKDLYIDDCPDLESLPEDGVLESVQHLYLKDCGKLYDRYRREDGPDWQKIAHIPDLEIFETKKFSASSSLEESTSAGPRHSAILKDAKASWTKFLSQKSQTSASFSLNKGGTIPIATSSMENQSIDELPRIDATNNANAERESNPAPFGHGDQPSSSTSDTSPVSQEEIRRAIAALQSLLSTSKDNLSQSPELRGALQTLDTLNQSRAPNVGNNPDTGSSTNN